MELTNIYQLIKNLVDLASEGHRHVLLRTYVPDTDSYEYSTPSLVISEEDDESNGRPVIW